MKQNWLYMYFVYNIIIYNIYYTYKNYMYNIIIYLIFENLILETKKLYYTRMSIYLLSYEYFKLVILLVIIF